MDQIKCSHLDCETTHAASYWDSIKASDKGWFVQKDGTAYCPEHVPEWVEEWRLKNAEKESNDHAV